MVRVKHAAKRAESARSPINFGGCSPLNTLSVHADGIGSQSSQQEEAEVEERNASLIHEGDAHRGGEEEGEQGEGVQRHPTEAGEGEGEEERPREAPPMLPLLGSQLENESQPVGETSRDREEEASYDGVFHSQEGEIDIDVSPQGDSAALPGARVTVAAPALAPPASAPRKQKRRGALLVSVRKPGRPGAAPAEGKKKRKWKSGTKALSEIKRYQGILKGSGSHATRLLLPRAPFVRLVRELVLDGGRRFSKGALECIQEAAEAYLIMAFKNAVEIMAVAKRVTLKPQDLTLAVKIMQSGTGLY